MTETRRGIVVSILTAMVIVLGLLALPAVAESPDRDNELVSLMQQAGLEIRDQEQAEAVLAEAQISEREALDLLREDLRYADTLVPLVIEEGVLQASSPGLASAIETGDFSTLASAGCGWAISDVNLKGGASGFTVAWHRLRTDWCWNSAKTAIVGTPTNEPVTFGITAYGFALGYTWKSGPSIDARQWVTPNWKYRISTTSTLEICPFRLGICYGEINPWIIHDMYGNGTVGKDLGY